MKKVLVVVTLAMMIGSSVFSIAQEPIKSENPAPTDSTKTEISKTDDPQEEAMSILNDTVVDSLKTATLTADIIISAK